MNAISVRYTSYYVLNPGADIRKQCIYPTIVIIVVSKYMSPESNKVLSSFVTPTSSSSLRIRPRPRRAAENNIDVSTRRSQTINTIQFEMSNMSSGSAPSAQKETGDEVDFLDMERDDLEEREQNVSIHDSEFRTEIT